MGYYKDLTKTSLDDYRNMLLDNYLIPSFRVLLKEIDQTIHIFKSHGITNMEELRRMLKNKKQDAIVSKKTGISEQYLAVLRRELNSHIPPERELKEYRTISQTTKNKLHNMDIKTSKDLYDHFAKVNDVEALQKQLDETRSCILHLGKLVDVSRLRYVSALFATALVLTPYDTVKKIRLADTEDLYRHIVQANKKHDLYKGNLGINDVRFLIQDTASVISDIEFID